MLIRHPSVQEVRSFKKCLTLFARASGLVVNPNKSQIFFMNTDIITQRNIIRILGFSKGIIPSKYLVIPPGMGQLKKASWQDLLDKMKKNLSNWVLRPLNLPSCLILVKAVMQAMPIYLFSILSALKSVLRIIRGMQRNFLWGCREEKAKFALVSWEGICKPKEQGGLGLRDLELMAEVQGAKKGRVGSLVGLGFNDH